LNQNYLKFEKKYENVILGATKKAAK